MSVGAWGDTTAALKEDGISSLLTGLFDPKPVYDYLSTKIIYNAHVQAKALQNVPFGDPIAEKTWPMFCFSMQDIITAPSIFECALGFLPVARWYFDEAPVLYSMNCFCTQPATGPEYKDTHWWHIDGDDRKQMVVFFMLTDIPTPMDGAHLYQKGSQVYNGNPPWDWAHPPEGKLIIITGKAGDAFITDTRGFHMAYRPRYRRRMVAWARFGVSDPPESYKWDKLSPVPKELMGDRYPSDPDTQRAIKLVVA